MTQKPREHRIAVRVSSEEYAALREQARADDRSVADYLRHLARSERAQKQKPQTPSPEQAQ